MSGARIGNAARLLGYAGLLPQAAAAALVATGIDARSGTALALAYGGVILSFLGGIWWGLAMRRVHRQGTLAFIAVLPSLAACTIALAAVFLSTGIALMLLAAALAATLLVDRGLAATGEAPAGWIGLRAPLSLGLAALSLVAALA